MSAPMWCGDTAVHPEHSFAVQQQGGGSVAVTCPGTSVFGMAEWMHLHKDPESVPRAVPGVYSPSQIQVETNIPKQGWKAWVRGEIRSLGRHLVNLRAAVTSLDMRVTEGERKVADYIDLVSMGNRQAEERDEAITRRLDDLHERLLHAERKPQQASRFWDADVRAELLVQPAMSHVDGMTATVGFGPLVVGTMGSDTDKLTAVHPEHLSIRGEGRNIREAVEAWVAHAAAVIKEGNHAVSTALQATIDNSISLAPPVPFVMVEGWFMWDHDGVRTLAYKSREGVPPGVQEFAIFDAERKSYAKIGVNDLVRPVLLS